MIKYICDNCGFETSKSHEVSTIKLETTRVDVVLNARFPVLTMGDYCDKCYPIVEEALKRIMFTNKEKQQ